MFNIGVEGQYLFGVFIAAVVGSRVTMPAPIHPVFVMLVAMIAAAAWAGIAGVLKVTRGVNEVIATIMLNGIALAVIEWMFQTWFRDSASNGLNVTTQPLPSSAWIPDLVHGTSPLNGFVLVTLLIALLYWLIVFKSRFGFRLRASGMNPVAARTSGISASRMIVVAMLLSGGIAGLVGMQSLLGNLHSYGLSIPTGYGFAGIAVALLGRNHPAGIIPAALLFGFLNATAGALQLKDVPSPIVEVMQAIILFTVVIFNEVVTRWLNRRTQAKTAAALELVGAPS
jgi:simple sugar transport system permease protein